MRAPGPTAKRFPGGHGLSDRSYRARTLRQSPSRSAAPRRVSPPSEYSVRRWVASSLEITRPSISSPRISVSPARHSYLLMPLLSHPYARASSYCPGRHGVARVHSARRSRQFVWSPSWVVKQVVHTARRHRRQYEPQPPSQCTHFPVPFAGASSKGRISLPMALPGTLRTPVELLAVPVGHRVETTRAPATTSDLALNLLVVLADLVTVRVPTL